MKYAVLIGDGMADDPLPELGGKTPLEHAETSNCDAVAQEGQAGLIDTIPEGMPPGSAVACMSIFGYDPLVHFSGRGPLEAGGMGVEVENDEYAFRCNIVNVDRESGIMVDYSAGHITSEQGTEILQGLSGYFKDEEGIRFYPGVSYRHLLKIKKELLGGIPECTPPHDITGKPFGEYLPKGKGADLLLDLIERSKGFLSRHPVNKKRAREGKRTANSIWPWSGGVKPDFPPYKQRFGLGGKVISAVDLVRGIAFFAGIETLDVPGITGYYDTNYKGKAEHAIQALDSNDIVFIHVEAPDEASHNGHLDEKIRAIENFDKIIVGPVHKALKAQGQYRIAVLPDHYTPISLRTHRKGPVPVVMCGSGLPRDGTSCFSEQTGAHGSFSFKPGHLFIEYFLGKR